MKHQAFSRQDLAASLSSYIALLGEQRDALAQLRGTSSEMRRALERGHDADVDHLLERRDHECRQLGHIRERAAAVDDVIQAARAASSGADDSLAKTARALIAMQADSQSLAEEVITCQNQCEAILKERIEATAGALRESTQRRKLDAVYGPAVKHTSPTFIDSHQ